MTALDILVLLLLGGGALIGFIRGFVHEALSLFAWLAGILAVRLFHAGLRQGLTAPVGTEAGASVLAFALLFIPTYVGVRLVARAAGGASRRSVLAPIDRLLGGGFGILKGLTLATLIFMLANLAADLVYGPQEPRPAWMTRSRTSALLNASSRAIVRWVEERRRPTGRETAR